MNADWCRVDDACTVEDAAAGTAAGPLLAAFTAAGTPMLADTRTSVMQNACTRSRSTAWLGWCGYSGAAVRQGQVSDYGRRSTHQSVCTIKRDELEPMPSVRVRERQHQHQRQQVDGQVDQQKELCTSRQLHLC